MDLFRTGERVTFENEWLRRHCPDFYPAPGVVGVVAETERDARVFVDWPAGSILYPRAERGWRTVAVNLKRVEGGGTG